MKPAAAIALVLALLAAATPAQADIANDAKIAKASGIPTPAATVITAPCPDTNPKATGEACTYADGRIYLPAGTDEFARQHELGHVFDAQYLSVGERNRATRLLGLRFGTPWNNGTGLAGFDSPIELFADAYAACRLALDPGRRWETGYDYMPTRHEFRMMCGFIQRAAR